MEDIQIKQMAIEILKEFLIEEFKKLINEKNTCKVVRTRENIKEICVFNKNTFFVASLIGLLEQTNYFDDDGSVK